MTEIGSACEAWASLAGWGFRRGHETTVVEEPGGRERSSLWTLVHVLSAGVDLAERGVEVPLGELLAPLPRYRKGDGYAPTPRARRRYFDDNAWLGLVSLRMLALTGEGSHLRRARRILAFLRSGQDPDGGVRWVEGRTPRNTCSTAPAAVLALSLSAIDGDADAVTFARDALDWLDATLRGRDGRYADHEDRGRVEPTIWSYNQGVAAGAHRRLAQVTRSDAAAVAARITALASLETFDDERLWREPPPFLAVWFRELLAFDDPAIREAADASLQGYAARLLQAALDPATGRFTRGGVGTYDGRATIDQAAVVQLLTMAAGPAGSPAS